MQRTHSIRGFLLLSSLLVGLSFPAVTSAQKLAPEDVVAKHLASLGTPEKRAAIRSRVLEGQARMDILVGGGIPLAGRALVVSEGPNYRVALEFLRQDYWGEQYRKEGDKVEVGYILPGRRSQMEDFLNKFPDVVREGLVGGALTTAWPLLDLQQHQPSLKYDGLKKVDGRQLHRLTYNMRKGGGLLTVYLFFDRDTFRHVRSYIQRVEPADMPATPAQAVSRPETRYTLEEEFSEFVEIEGLTLPTMWTIRMTAEKAIADPNLAATLPGLGPGNSVLRWRVAFDKLFHNVPIKPEEMAIEPPGRVADPKQPKPVG
jgi:hypothetical protein